jgi:peptidyl-prolyl cis-trans isomerase-like 1
MSGIQASEREREPGSETGAGADAGDVTFDTALGSISFELYWLHAPKSAKNFFELARSGECDSGAP